MVSSVESISFGTSSTALASDNTHSSDRGCASSTLPTSVNTQCTVNTAQHTVPDFLFGPENALLRVSVEPLVRNAECAFRPLVFVGPSGIGKSHLATGIAAATTARVVHLAAADFARQATEEKSPADAADRFRSLHRAEVLIVEDVHRLAKKTAAQTALASLLDALVARDATIIVTSNVAPAKLPNFTPALIDRLTAGLVVALAPPSPAVRRAMIAHIADREQLEITSDAADQLADAPLASWNEIRGTLLELRFANGSNDASIRVADVRRLLADKPASTAPDIRDLAVAVAKHFGLRLSDLQGRSRRRGVVDARNITAFLARKSTSLSLQQIGQYLGGRDHTTILHGIRKIEQQLAEDPVRRQVIEDLMPDSLWKTCPTTVNTLLSNDDT